LAHPRCSEARECPIIVRRWSSWECSVFSHDIKEIGVQKLIMIKVSALKYVRQSSLPVYLHSSTLPRWQQPERIVHKRWE
jgi:hypothetical protein